MDLQLPGGRHDNDHPDIRAISIIPTCDEIFSSYEDYLPAITRAKHGQTNNSAHQHLDQHFRLLRYDVIGNWKAAIRELVFSASSSPQPRGCGSDVQLYRNATAQRICVSAKKGLEVRISFDAPTAVCRQAPAERRYWWTRYKKLERGTLICFLCSDGVRHVPLALIVTEQPTGPPTLQRHLTPGSEHATMVAQLTPQNVQDVEMLIQSHRHRLQGVLVECPGLIVESFKPALENLQDMMYWKGLPFQKWIIPGTRSRNMAIPPPRYAQGAGFAFPLGSIVQCGRRSLQLSPQDSPDSLKLIEDLEFRTGLDRGQCQCLVAALTREYALLQGPPGTGKSFLGVKLVRVLLDCRAKSDLGPIIIV